MSKPNYIENHVELIDSIIKSINDNFFLLEQSVELNKVIYDTVCNILKFLNNSLKLLPLILFTRSKDSVSKEQLIESFEQVLSSWSEYLVSKESFTNDWNVFVHKWDSYKADFSKTSNSTHTIYISMN
ncbi:MAG: hypothetical protein CVV22_01220 [Ignavibacteriae bacterium HGW-Ignavibacteriae-1]|jgi:hypothetical protein|nr:MAG: hypothetical protein CVV22_01220 [Ignavibacteriae bacterium HGW-Ignavibacteriae-1]